MKWTELDITVDLRYHRERRVKDPSEVFTPMSKDIWSNFGKRTGWDNALRLTHMHLRLPEGMFWKHWEIPSVTDGREGACATWVPSL